LHPHQVNCYKKALFHELFKHRIKITKEKKSSFDVGFPVSKKLDHLAILLFINGFASVGNN
jgi:hypothetical protein